MNGGGDLAGLLGETVDGRDLVNGYDLLGGYDWVVTWLILVDFCLMIVNSVMVMVCGDKMVDGRDFVW